MTTVRYTSEADRWTAVLERDAAADGAFYYAVRTTGVYCRPTCAGRRPLPVNVAFYDTPAEAERAGFRACRRCLPNAVTAEQRAVAAVQRLLAVTDRPLTLGALAEAMGYSPSHLQRVFKRATGMSPRAYAAALRMQRLKTALREGAPVTAATYAAGYGSTRAVYEAAVEELGMTPSAYRKGGRGQTIAYDVCESAAGPLLIAATDRGLCAVRFGDVGDLVAELTAEFPHAALCRDAGAVAGYRSAILALAEGLPSQEELPQDVAPTAFQQRVWAALRSIPCGQQRTYTEVAEMIGQPTAARAVAQACARNPLALVNPCHRVVAAGGGLGGYRWGVARKRLLLALEQGRAEPPATAP